MSEPTKVTTELTIDHLAREIAELRSIIERHEASLRMGLTRMGQLQADIDTIRNAWAKMKAGA